MFLAELTLTDYVSIKWLPSEIAASAVLLARLCLAHKTWTPTLEYTTQHSAEDLWPCVQHIHSLHTAVWQSALPATREKFSLTAYKSAASIPAVKHLPSPFSL
jgi:cyclin A